MHCSKHALHKRGAYTHPMYPHTLGGKLRRDLMAEGGVAPVVAAAQLGGAEERFMFARAVSRLYEMQTPRYGLDVLALAGGQ